MILNKSRILDFTTFKYHLPDEEVKKSKDPDVEEVKEIKASAVTGWCVNSSRLHIRLYICGVVPLCLGTSVRLVGYICGNGFNTVNGKEQNNMHPSRARHLVVALLLFSGVESHKVRVLFPTWRAELTPFPMCWQMVCPPQCFSSFSFQSTRQLLPLLDLPRQPCSRKGCMCLWL